DGCIDYESGGRARRRVETQLQQIVYQDTWFLQIRIQIMQSFVDGARYGRSYAFGYWSQYCLICRQYLAICCLVGIAAVQRGAAGRALACAHEQRCHPRGRPFAPQPSATHLLFPAADDWFGTAQMASRRVHAPAGAAPIQSELG